MLLEKIKRSIEAIGPINWAVSDEYEEQSKRLNILKEQRSDLLNSEKNLKENGFLQLKSNPKQVKNI